MNAPHAPFLRPETGGVDPRLAGGRLTVDLSALAHNYRQIARRVAPARVAGVVKADAYGLGAARVAPALWNEGCEDFFVAMPEEGRALREILPQARIFVLSGPFGPEAAPAFVEAGLIPVLNSPADVATWEAHGHLDGRPLPCALHVDTGMNRLGLTPGEAGSLAAENELTGALAPVLIMSHLACADSPGHHLNRLQLESFRQLGGIFSGIESSLANSAGCLLGTDYAFDLVRPGIALYGGMAAPGLRPVATAEARIVQVRQVPAGSAVSYGAAETLRRDTAVAVVSAGYADGYHRAASGAGVPLRKAVPFGATGFIKGFKVPVLGRVTMDLTLFDVTDLGPDGALAGEHVELFGPNVAIEEAAEAAGTISYELLTSLGRRYHRRYLGGTE